MKTTDMVCSFDCESSTAILAASAPQWNLPRAKNMLSPACFYTSLRTGAALSIPFLGSTIKNSRPKGRHFYGGAEGNRTPVRRQLDRTFSGRSLLFTFPLPHGNKHPYGISSFIMHGTRKALRTHVLYSNHTRARLVDLPGRMGA